MNQSPNQSNQRPFLNQVTVQSRIRIGIRIGIGICGGANGQFVYLARGNLDRNRALRRPRFGINWRPASTVPRPRTFASACPTRSKDPAVSRTRCHTTNQGQMITSLSASLSINAEGGKVGRWEGGKERVVVWGFSVRFRARPVDGAGGAPPPQITQTNKKKTLSYAVDDQVKRT